MNSFSIRHGVCGVWFGVFSHFARLNVKHGISTRLGGLSQPPYDTLNLGIKSGDSPETVIKNRRLFCQAVGVPFQLSVAAQQVHGTRVYTVEKSDGGRGAESYDTAIPDTDALVTAEPGIPLMLFFADCVPVLIYDPVQRVAAVCHAGWKGTVGKIARETVLTMQEKFSSRPADCLVGIGPSIGPEQYEVDETVIDALRKAFPWWEKVAVPRGERWMLDLWRTNRLQLEEIGVQSHNIETSEVSTLVNQALFYSHRGGKGVTGRMGAVMML